MCVANAREDRPARRSWPFFSILKTDPPVDGSDLVVFLDLFPKVGKTTRPVGHSSTCTSDLYRRRVRLSRLCPFAGPGRAAPGSYRGPAGLRNATGSKASAHTTGPALRPAAGFGTRRGFGHTTGPGLGTPFAQRDGSDFVVGFLHYHPVKVAKCLVTSSS